jgi:isopentenyl-diphosphate delta-isomerase
MSLSKTRHIVRKKDHLDLVSRSEVTVRDPRFSYEPLLAAHPVDLSSLKIHFLGKELGAPVWISSMTGGVKESRRINENLAVCAREFGLGMGLGSCRSLLEGGGRWKDFSLRPLIGPDLPLFANLGIAQVADLVSAGEENRIHDMVARLQSSGLIIHVNPLQEFLQMEGTPFSRPPFEIIEEFLSTAGYPVIVKEVGQGMGPASLKKLISLPLAAIEFAGIGGTNFSLVELLRRNDERGPHEGLVFVGHSAREMAQIIREEQLKKKTQVKCTEFILSGGVRNYLDGYSLMSILPGSSIYGLAGPLLGPARKSAKALKEYMHDHLKGLAFAKAFLSHTEAGES